MTLKKLIALSLGLVFCGSCLAVAGEGTPKTYIIKKGDTLWGVSERFLKDPQYWPNLWSNNEYVTNPHLIYPGQKITIYDGRTLVVAEQKKATGVREVEQTIEPDAITLRTYGGAEGFVLEGDMEGLGVIVDTVDNRILLTKNDLIFIKARDPESLRVGDHLSVYRKGKKVMHPRSGKKIGHQVIDVGEVVIHEVNDDVVTGQILEATQEIQRGDCLAPKRPRTQEIVMKKSDEAVSGCVISSATDQMSLGSYDLLYFDVGAADGLEPGHIVYLSRERKTTEKALVKSDLELPDVLLGSALVLETREHTSAAMILKSRESVFVGDKVFTVKR